MFDYETARQGLRVLHQAALALGGWQGEQSETFIRVGEYGLALDEIAYAYLDSKVAMPEKLFQIFDELAVSMELDSDPEFDGVAQLRKMQGTAS